ncbi:hypothetical protein WN944_023606 [Citrus x changshan-huyou]|uniref:RING-type E3 ubiquitin transferase n=1 Tax=Citrus x changshan-huyou TaxID=2935761 RepID=A0AAP0N5S9_9ROSI
MVHVECDSIFDLEVEDLDNDGIGESKSSITFYLHPNSSYKKEWWYTNSSNSSDASKNKLVYRIEEYVDVTENYVENIDVEEMLSMAASAAALITLISGKALVALEPAASQDELKELASDVISESCRRLAAKPNISKYTFLIGICARYHISTSLDETDMKELQEYPGAAADDEYDPSLMPLPIIIDDGYDFFELSQESCAICWDKYLPGSQVIRMQCLDEVDHLIHNNHHHHHQYLSSRGSDAIAIVMPCSHQFHANCISNWLKSTNSCPLCRFQMPSCATLLSILDLFDSEVHSEKS